MVVYGLPREDLMEDKSNIKKEVKKEVHYTSKNKKLLLQLIKLEGEKKILKENGK